jgi:hypothetical protein
MTTPPAPPPHMFTATHAGSTADYGYQVVGQHQSPRGAGAGMSFDTAGYEPPDLHVPDVPGTDTAPAAGNEDQADTPGGHAELGGTGGAIRHLSAGQFAGEVAPETAAPAAAAGESAASDLAGAAIAAL